MAREWAKRAVKQPRASDPIEAEVRIPWCWLMKFVWFPLQVVSTDTLAVGSSRAIDSLAPVAKDKRDQITSFSTLASSQLLGRCVAERSRFDRFQLSGLALWGTISYLASRADCFRVPRGCVVPS